MQTVKYIRFIIFTKQCIFISNLLLCCSILDHNHWRPTLSAIEWCENQWRVKGYKVDVTNAIFIYKIWSHFCNNCFVATSNFQFKKNHDNRILKKFLRHNIFVYVVDLELLGIFRRAINAIWWENRYFSLIPTRFWSRAIIIGWNTLFYKGLL